MMNLQTPLPPTSSPAPAPRASRAPVVPAARRGTGRRRQRRKPSSSPSTRVGEAEHEQPDALARILRTEAAVSGVSRKAAAARQQSTNLWPRAVLEALDSAVAACRWESALEIFELLRKQHWYEPRSQTYARLLMMLGKCRQPGPAAALFKAMLSERLRPTADVYTALVGAYGYSGLLDEALAAVEQMKGAADCKPDGYTFSVLINCCAKSRRFDLIPAVLDEMSYLGIECNSVIHNAIIDGYGKAAMFEEMEGALSAMLESGSNVPDIYTMNSVIGAYGNHGRTDEMEKSYSEFQLMGVEPDTKTFNIMIKSYVIECFGRAGNIEKMEYYFRLMKIQGVKPNPITYCSLVNGYSKAGLLDKVPGIIRQTENTNVVLDTPFFNCVISAYAKSGDIKIMEEMLQLMKEKKCKPDKITYATMIQAYTAQGMDEAARLLEMEAERFDKRLLGPVSEVDGE
ncbi:pentatricopeptide repeat-containing protein At3g53170 isoform X2 [Sorghum bicolor]|uniref:pentatricopeptide repeat-containing protein At3g53170 isoform X2 n=1 Tax=Sorghum bicolor TaxID=4558 RepID=UPI000B4269A1|nr:pentatricopeptide repeat-containing protein At3g53170 isoform X2 [Sorghum bicolor]|eukprot:XP_021303127.1 pentatricopeptide repeat-containing protein At3g53170 isoform X2 [Sorghum bicolor]